MRLTHSAAHTPSKQQFLATHALLHTAPIIFSTAMHLSGGNTTIHSGITSPIVQKVALSLEGHMRTLAARLFYTM